MSTVIHAVLRFLWFQAPWAYGKTLFALLRSVSVETWAKTRHRRMKATERLAEVWNTIGNTAMMKQRAAQDHQKTRKSA